MNKQPLHVIKNQIDILLSLDEIEKAIKYMETKIAPITNELDRSIILNSGAYTALKNRENDGLITSENFQVEKRRISHRLLGIMNTVPDQLKIKQIMQELDSVYATNYEATLEKIQGENNNLMPVNWLQKAIQVSKGVCQVVMANGDKGTGWILEGGWLMTNHHVIPNKEKAKTAKIVFDYEEDIYGANRKTSEFRLDHESAIFSNLFEMDYAYIKVIDNPDTPLSNWGSLTINTLQEPQVGHPVNIIQHPLGQKKQIALTENKILNVDGNKLFYQTDTERGSSGAPVFNIEWEVIALHHAGKTEEDGGLIINAETGEKRGANEGILISFIMDDIHKKLNTNR